MVERGLPLKTWNTSAIFTLNQANAFTESGSQSTTHLLDRMCKQSPEKDSDDEEFSDDQAMPVMRVSFNDYPLVSSSDEFQSPRRPSLDVVNTDADSEPFLKINQPSPH